MPEYTVYHVRYPEYDYSTPERKPTGRDSHAGSYLDEDGARRRLDSLEENAAKYNLDTRGKYRIVTEQYSTDFEMPSESKPRDLYCQEEDVEPSRPGCWDVANIRVYRKTGAGPGEQVAEYHRNYPYYHPFEPFRQFRDGTEHHYALISRDYTATSVLDLATGQVIAAEPGSSWGFCPVGFYVPDWRDVHDGSVFPGSPYWEDRWDRWPDGTLGFVWGCVWGDDNGWKIQALDLSRVAEGVITRDERFGYQHLEDYGTDPSRFIRVFPGNGNRGPTVTFTVPREFMISGEPTDFYDNYILGRNPEGNDKEKK